MAEISFARSFLTALDTKPSKITADHVEDPRSYPARTPYTLPRLPKAMTPRRTRRSGAAAAGAERGVAVSVRSLRGPALHVDLEAQPRSTSVLQIKAAVAARAGIAADRIRVLHRKKPVPDSKALGDLLPATDDDAEESAGAAPTIELSVMIMGGGSGIAAAGTSPSPGAGEAGGGIDGGPKAAAAPGAATAAAVLETDEFWGDLKGFLQQRLRDEAAADDVLGHFKGAWKGRR